MGLAIDGCELLKEQARNTILRVLFLGFRTKVDGCFGAVFLDLQRDPAYSGRRIGERSINRAILSTLFLLYMAGLG